MKREGVTTRRRNMPMRENTPLRTEGAGEVHSADTVAASTSSTDVTFDAEMTDATSIDATGANAPDPLYLFGRKGRQLIQKMQELQCLGIDATLPSLPKVVCIGDQSAGKSSIIEAMSDITLPRSEGTCTRCPFRITTHASEPDVSKWSCTISLQFAYSYLPGYADSSAGLPGWKKYGDIQVEEFARISSKSELELNLRRAQIAILNPNRSWRHCVHLTMADVEKAEFQVDFAPNVICLEITAPDLLEMAFYDLPGAINVKEDASDDYLAEFVEAVLKNYIADEEALIVIACPANQDFHNGIAFKYLRKYKAIGRAIGVLTKPDLVDALTTRRLESFENMFSAKAFSVEGGWYMTRQLSQAQLNAANCLTYQEARAQEATFFSQPPWSTQFSIYADRFGISNLQEAISRKHIGHILRSLPKIVQRVQERLTDVQQQLREYPSKPTNPGLELIYDVDKVVTAVVAQCSADSKSSPFRGAQRGNLMNFRKQLAAIAPRVELSTPGYVKPSISITDSDEEKMDNTPSKRFRGENGRAQSVTPRRPAPACSSSARTPTASGSKRKMARPPVPETGVSATTFQLDEVKRRFDLAPNAQLPDAADPRITDDMATESLSGFSALTQQALDRFGGNVVSMLKQCLANSLATRQGTLLYEEMASIMRALFDELFEKEVEIIHHNISCLIHRPITYSKEWWDTKRDEHLQKLRQGRTEARVLERLDDMEAEGLKVPSTLEERKKKATDPVWIANNVRSPAFEIELKELAVPLTFYELASSQLVDNVARNLDFLIYQIENRLKTRLLEGLRPTDSQRAATLLAEDPKREEMRATLESEKQKLELAIEKLEILSSTDH